MKKRLCILLCAVLAVALAGCSSVAPVKDVSMTAPEGFVEDDSDSADSGHTYYSPTYPADGSNIIITTTEKDPLFSLYTGEALAKAVEDQLKSSNDLDVDIQSSDFKRFKVDGLSALSVVMTYEVSGIAIKQLELVVNADQSYIFVFTQIGDADWMDAFNQSVETIKFIYE